MRMARLKQAWHWLRPLWGKRSASLLGVFGVVRCILFRGFVPVLHQVQDFLLRQQPQRPFGIARGGPNRLADKLDVINEWGGELTYPLDRPRGGMSKGTHRARYHLFISSRKSLRGRVGRQPFNSTFTLCSIQMGWKFINTFK